MSKDEMTKERYNALKDWLVNTALKFYSMNGIFKNVAEKEEWFALYKKENEILDRMTSSNKKRKEKADE